MDRWRPRIDLTNARHAKMLRVVIGETLERRFFEQALAGRHDLLERRHLRSSFGEVLRPLDQ